MNDQVADKNRVLLLRQGLCSCLVANQQRNYHENNVRILCFIPKRDLDFEIILVDLCKEWSSCRKKNVISIQVLLQTEILIDKNPTRVVLVGIEVYKIFSS